MNQPFALLPNPDDSSAWRAWADARLTLLDLSVDLLHQALEVGQRKKEAAGSLAPSSTPGTDNWSGTVSGFRELTGWPPDQADQLPRTVHPSGKFFVVVKTGTGGVGTFGPGRPKTKYPIGPILQRAISRVPSTMPLFDINYQSIDLDEDNAPDVWLLLITSHNGMVYAELSRPSAHKDGEITDYHQRIQLPPFEFNTTIRDDSREDSAETEETPATNIDVRPIEN